MMNTMKKHYDDPWYELEKFTIRDVLTKSTQDNYDDEDDDLTGGSAKGNTFQEF